MKRFFLVSVVIMLLGALILAGCAAPATAPAPAPSPAAKPAPAPAPAAEKKDVLPKTLSFGTNPKGSLMNNSAAAIAKVLSARLPLQATDRPYSGQPEWFPLLDAGELDMGYSGANGPFDSYRGLWAFKKPCTNVRLISHSAPLMNMLFTRADAGIRKWADLKGKRMAYNPQLSSGTEGMKMEIYLKEMGGITPKDVTIVPVTGMADAAQAVGEGRADAAFGAPTSSTTKEAAAKAGGLFWLESAENNPAVRKQLAEKGIWHTSVVKFMKAGEAGELKNDQWASQDPTTWVAYSGLSDYTVYMSLKTIYENLKEAIDAFPGLNTWTKEGFLLADNTESWTAPFHPGAIRFYKEIGEWKAKHDTRQAELLAMAKK